MIRLHCHVLLLFSPSSSPCFSLDEKSGPFCRQVKKSYKEEVEISRHTVLLCFLSISCMEIFGSMHESSQELVDASIFEIC